MICSGVVVMFDAWSPLAARRGEGSWSWHPGPAWGGWVQALVGPARAMCVSQSAPGYRIPSALSPSSPSQ